MFRRTSYYNNCTSISTSSNHMDNIIENENNEFTITHLNNLEFYICPINHQFANINFFINESDYRFYLGIIGDRNRYSDETRDLISKLIRQSVTETIIDDKLFEQRMCNDSDKSCEQFLFELKTIFNLNEAGKPMINAILDLISETLPNSNLNNVLHTYTYDKILNTILETPYKTLQIDICPTNGCEAFFGRRNNNRRCSICNAERYLPCSQVSCRGKY